MWQKLKHRCSGTNQGVGGPSELLTLLRSQFPRPPCMGVPLLAALPLVEADPLVPCLNLHLLLIYLLNFQPIKPAPLSPRVCLLPFKALFPLKDKKRTPLPANLLPPNFPTVSSRGHLANQRPTLWRPFTTTLSPQWVQRITMILPTRTLGSAFNYATAHRYKFRLPLTCPL